MFDPTRRDDLMPMRQIIKWSLIGICYYGVIAAGLWALTGCSGGGGSSPNTAGTSAACASGSTQCGNNNPGVVLPACTAGITDNYAHVCICPAAYVNNAPPGQSGQTAECEMPCPAGYQLGSGNLCEAIPPPPPVLTCAAGYIPEDGACVAEGCAPGYVLTNGQCVLAPPPPVVCPPGDTLINGFCVAPPPLTMSISQPAATPGVVGYTVTWNSTGASTCEFGEAGASVQVPLSGNECVAPPQTATFVLVCGNGSGNAAQSVTVSGSPAPSQPCPSNYCVDTDTSDATFNTCIPGETDVSGICHPTGLVPCYDTPTSPPGPPPPPPTPTCPPGELATGGVCAPLNLTIATASPSVVNNSAGCPDPAGNPCTTNVIPTPAWPPQCYFGPYAAGPALNSADGLSVGPYTAAEGSPQTIDVTCTDLRNTVTVSAFLIVNPPAAPPPDVFTMAGGNPYVFTWQVSGVNGCYVSVIDGNNGVDFSPSQGGGTSGTATTAMLPGNTPFSATLVCGGVLDRGAGEIDFTTAP